MALGLLLLPAVGGFWFLTHWNYTRFRIVRESGYHLLFLSAAYGISLYILASLITFGLDLVCPFPTLFWDTHVPEPFTSEVMLSLLIGVLAPFGLNRIWRLEDSARRTAREIGDHVELLLDRSLRERRLVQLDLRNRKTYVGYALETGIGKSADADVILLPMLSGFRDENTLKLTLETNYSPIVRQYLQRESGLRGPDFRVVIPLNEIAFARLFDRTVFRSFQQHTDRATPSEPS